MPRSVEDPVESVVASALVTMPDAQTRTEVALNQAMGFGRRLGYETYDPFDVKSTPFISRTYVSPTLFKSLVRKAVFGAELYWPIKLREFLKVPKRASAGGVARWAQACMACFRLDGSSDWLDESERALTWLLEHPGDSPAGVGWGVPFAWTTYFGEVPANTAVSHTTHNCGSAFLDFHDLTGQAWAFEAAERCCQFLAEALYRTERESGSVALSYTPLDRTQVVNISAESAAFLLRCGRPSDQPLVWKLAKFVVEDQAEDGSWMYSAQGSVSEANPIDHYHTAMVLNGLCGLLADKDCRMAFDRGLAFHLDNHFLDDGCPKMRPDSVSPVDSFSAGESLLLLTRALGEGVLDSSKRPHTESVLSLLLDFTLRELSYNDGGFVYRKYGRRAMRIDSLRWAQALLCHALAEVCLLERSRIQPE